MAGEEGKRPRRKSRPLNYFYLDTEDGLNLHKKLHINRAADTITTWCYPLHKRVAYSYSYVLRNKKPAFSTKQVAELLNCGRLRLERAILEGHIEAPQKTYGINERKNGFAYYWHEKNVLDAHAFFLTVHMGRPRKDGLITPMKMPTARELRAMMRGEQILYVRKEDGTFEPTWRAEDF